MKKAAIFRNNVDVSGNLDIKNNLLVSGNTTILGVIDNKLDISNNVTVFGDISLSGKIISSNHPITNNFGFAQMNLDTTYNGTNKNINRIRVPFNNTLNLNNDNNYYNIVFPDATSTKTNKGIKILKTGIYKVSYSIILENENKVIISDEDSDINWKIVITETKDNESIDISMGTSYAFTSSTRYYYLNNTSSNFSGLMKLNKDCYYNIEISVYVGYS